MANYPADCVIGKTFWHAPSFIASDFPVSNASGGNFSNPNQLSLGGTSGSVVRTPVYIPGLKIVMQYLVNDSGASSVGGSLWMGGGGGLTNSIGSTDPFTSQPEGMWVVPHGGTVNFVMNTYITTNYDSGSKPAGVAYSVIATWTIDDNPHAFGGNNYYRLTRRLQVAALGIDQTWVDDQWQQDIYLYAHFFMVGTTSATNSMVVTDLYMTGRNLAGMCLGPTPAPWPDLKSAYPGDPAACVLGKKTSYFLDEFNISTLPPWWKLLAGTFIGVNGYATMDSSDAVSKLLKLKWIGKLLDFDPADHLSLEIAGHVDAVNAGSSAGGFETLGLKITFPDLANWALIKLQRDPAGGAVYRVYVSESWGSERLIATPAFTAYPLEITLRIDVYFDAGVIYYINGVNITSTSYPTWLTVPYVLPEIWAGLDTTARAYLYYFYVSGSPGFPDLCEGPSSARVVSYRNMLVNLLPQGFPWRNLNQLFRILLKSLGVEMDRVHGRTDDLLTQSNPGTATIADLLAEWERIALLPEELPAGGETEAQRQAVVAAKVTTHYSGQSRQFFIDLAASLGFAIEIQENGISSGARSGIARTGTGRIGSMANIFIWNIRILTDTFSAETTYWEFDGDEDLTTYPGSVTPKNGAGGTDLVFVGGPLTPAFPVVPLSASYPLKFRFQLRTFFNGAVNHAFAIITWSEAVDFSTDFVSFIFGYVPGTPGYTIDVSGTQAGSPWADFQTIGAAHTDPLLGNFDILITMSTTGFKIEIPLVGYTYIGTGFVFPNIRFLDINLQRADALNYGVLDGARVYTDEPNPSSPVSKFQAMVERLKPSHTQVTYT